MFLLPTAVFFCKCSTLPDSRHTFLMMYQQFLKCFPAETYLIDIFDYIRASADHILGLMDEVEDKHNWKCKTLMSVCWLVGRSVVLSDIISLKGSNRSAFGYYNWNLSMWICYRGIYVHIMHRKNFLMP